MEQLVRMSDFHYIRCLVNDEAEEFRLYQNFPQTFYKMTKIAFDIPHAANVKLMIYDVFGREIEVLVNEKLSKGSYEIKWDAYKFSGGVYYYKIYAEDFVDSKKMILLKRIH